jgi:hypothetical protein
MSANVNGLCVAEQICVYSIMTVHARRSNRVLPRPYGQASKAATRGIFEL